MLQYILTASAIWLTSIILFDLFLRKETTHDYNRMYLLGSFIAGLLVPLIPLEADPVLSLTAMDVPAQQIAIAKQTVVQSTVNSHFVLTWEDWIFIVYVAGAVVSFLFLLKELVQVFHLKSGGTITRNGIWTIVETGKEHSPFSFFKYIFINSKSRYTDDELTVVFIHEQQHGRLLHVLDIAFLQLAKVVFWFHPLVYIYYNRLLMVHEYQADAVITQDTAGYGQFLVEQSLLSSAPVIAHSFNRSPIKKRLMMLSKRNTRPSRAKQWLIVPLLLLTVSCFKKEMMVDNTMHKNGNKVTYRGNNFEMYIFPNDTIEVEESVTKERTIAITTRNPVPIKLNGRTIYTTEGVNTPPELTDRSLRKFILDDIASYLEKLDDGKYSLFISNVVMDESGRIVYFDYEGVRGPYDNKYKKLPVTKSTPQLLKDIDKQVVEAMHSAPRLAPAKLNGKLVPCLMENGVFDRQLEIKNGKLLSM